MRIHRIHLQHYRGVRDLHLRVPETGVTIVEGDNEVGKSSIAESLDLLFRHRDSSTRKEIKEVQPVHLDEGPYVEVELTTGEYHLTYAKRWHRQKQTTLTVHAPVPEQLTGREAHDRAQAILEQTLDDGLWDALRLQQGAAAAQAHLDVSSLGQALDLAAGGERTGDREDLLWERATAERDRWWTAIGQPRGERVAAADAVNQAQAQVAQITQRIADLDDAADEIARLTTAAATLEADQAQRSDAELQLRRRAEVVAARRTELDRAMHAVDRAQTQADVLRSEANRRSELVHAQQEAERLLAVRRQELDDAQPHHDEAVGRARAADLAAAAAREVLADAEQRLQLATDDRDDRRRAIEVEQFRERLDAVQQADERLAEAASCLETCRVDRGTVRRIDQANTAVLKAEGALGRDATSLRITGLRDHRVLIDSRPTPIATDESIEHTVTGAVQLVVADVARIEITPDASSLALAEQLAEAVLTFKRLCDEAGVTDLDEARDLAAARSAAERAQHEAAAAKQASLRDLTEAELSAKVRQHEQRLAEHAARRPEHPPLPVDLAAARGVLAEVRSEVERARSRAEQSQAACAAAEAEVTRAQVEDAGYAAHVKDAEATLRHAELALVQARAARPDEAIAAELATSQLAAAGADAVRLEAEASLAAEDPHTLDQLLQNAVAARDRTAAALRQNHERRHHLQGVILGGGGDGLGPRLDEATTALAHHQVAHRRLEERAAAALLLHDTLRARRDEARDRYVAPFRERIERLGRLVFGPTLQIELDAQLDIASRTLDGVTVPFAALSTGAKEQLSILSRLACASIVSADGGAPVILDDALGWTDPGRLDGMGAAISMAGRDCQVIVLTCTPGRYGSVGQATVVHLPSSGSSEAVALEARPRPVEGAVGHSDVDGSAAA
jgi:hypothetical protein